MAEIVEEIVKRHLTPASNYIYGFADLTGLVDKKFAGYNYGISIGRLLDNEIVDKIINGPTLEYYLHYKQINEELSDLTDNIKKDLKKNKIKALNIEPTVSTSELDSTYYKTLRTDLSHKMVATRAGLGWIGKSDLFVSKKSGTRLRLVSILLRTPVFPLSKPLDISRCGTCNICVEICPVKAASGKLWNINTDRDEFFNALKCREQCAEFGRIKLGMNARVCGICVAACPVGQKQPDSSHK